MPSHLPLSHEVLDKRIQKWINQQGWPELREIQQRALSPVIAKDTDVLISAATASGKTEAFFLPALSEVADQHEGVSILYISPLKALINDQYRRLQGLGDLLKMRITSWHGDSSPGQKAQLRKNPSGVLLITPESLEALLMTKSGWLKKAFSALQYVVIDEFHAFIGQERGQHLLSLLNRLEHTTGRLKKPIPRVALSATLGELETIPQSLRPNQSLPCAIITSEQNHTQLKIQLKGYLNPIDVTASEYVDARYAIARDLFRFCRGGSHLIFANSRARTETIAAQLTQFCLDEQLPNEFFPHHGSLSKELREALEKRLLRGRYPTSAVCTMTLELGLDVGQVDSVVQVTTPSSLSSLRQRMGRSGRRDAPAVLRVLIAENEVAHDAPLSDLLRLELIQALAMLRLLLTSKWFEPADISQYHFSTLIHQVLSVVAQWGGIRAEQLFSLLCQEGPFQNVTPAHFITLLRQLGKAQLLTQLGSGELTLGLVGEKITNHYSFYAAFKTPEEYRVIAGAKTLGTLPVDTLLLQGQHILFGGKGWVVMEVNVDKKVILVKRSSRGTVPHFEGGAFTIHGRIRQEMYDMLVAGEYRIPVGDRHVDFIDDMARILFHESLLYFNQHGLKDNAIISHAGIVCILPWQGDKVVATLTALLLRLNFETSAYGGIIEVHNSHLSSVQEAIIALANAPLPAVEVLATLAEEKVVEKFDEYLPEELLDLGYGERTFDLPNTQRWLVRARAQLLGILGD
jgi:ATP-dependent helicase Lhr and Lhr-like helicase